MPRPKEAILSQNLIRDQALAIVDEDGLSALTMRRLATRLGVQAASLYTHFANKEAVLDAVAERLAKRIDPTGFDDSWQHGLRTWANSYYTALHWHPNAAPVLVARTRDSGSADAVTDRLAGHGWHRPQAVMVSAAVQFLVLGAATDPSGTRLVDHIPGATGAGPLDHFADTVERASFTLALDCLILGLESEFDAAGRQPGRRRTRRAAAG